MLKKVFTICAVSVLGCSLVSGYEIVIDSTIGDYMRNDSSQVVHDLKTNLIWQDDESAKSVVKNWQGAIEYCQNLNFAGYSDWRLPRLEELRTIVDKNNSPTIKSEFKNAASDYYWSSTPNAGGRYSAWGIHFDVGNEDSSNKGNDYNVRCVRDNISEGYRNNKGNNFNEKNIKEAPNMDTGSL